MSFLKRFIPPKIYQQIRSALLFRAEDPNNLLQVPPQRETGVNVERIKGYRYPAPGSQPQPKVPAVESEDDLYDVKFYSRDPRNLPSEDYMALNTSKEPTLFQPFVNKNSTPGTKIAAVAQYDPSGLRSTMTATWAAMDKAVAQVAPTHLPEPEWWKDQEAMQLDRERKGLPAAVGRVYPFKSVTPNYNKIKW